MSANRPQSRGLTAIAGAIISGFLFLACLGLYLFVARIDSEVRKS